VALNSEGVGRDAAQSMRLRRRLEPDTNRDDQSGRPMRRRVLFWLGLAVLVVVIGSGAWVAVRAFMAKDALVFVQVQLRNVQEDVVAGKTDQVLSVVGGIQLNAHRAADLTGDFVWRAWEYVPVIGPNLTAERETAKVVDYVISEAVQPLLDVAEAISGNALKPVDGAIQLGPIQASQAKIALVSYVITSAANDAAEIGTSGTLKVVSDAVSHLHSALARASEMSSALNRTVQLLPSMMGSGGPRNYLLLAQNLAEVRATGGIPGSVALLEVNQGKVQLVTQTTAIDLKKFVPPVAGLNSDLQHLYSDRPAQYMQDTTMVPEFSRVAQLASNMWTERTGQVVDGVLSVDPVAIGYLLKATGSVQLPTGEKLTADNAVKLLLRDVYFRYGPEKQDQFFSTAARTVFEEVVRGGAKPSDLLVALGKAASENRLLLWSSHPEEQLRLSETTMSGKLPQSTKEAGALGLYLNDGVGGKMDYYLKVELATGTRRCRSDGLNGYLVQAKLTNTAPLDAATSYPAYVTGNGWFGVPPGVIATQVNAYGSPDMIANTAWASPGILEEGADVSRLALEPIGTGSDAGRPVMQAWVELAPGESKTVVFEFLGSRSSPSAVALSHTPALNLTEIQSSPVGCF
jgi:hypothetical protein